ncbi:Protein spaetzle [Habropoda laboriosa]|uniref:Protein spaetzle n=1 Tax=Habropoda laboriosa TaxID=597456 RepID=A0A0L7RHY8_9HYME|nr:PREDICTED: protein spaetzle-like [Habropoda laboriosa]KOC70607.1 Protein spaetzle [Habropoda laboriosa]
MGRGYDGGLILMLAEFCFLTVLVTQNACAYPHKIDQNERNIDQFPDILSYSNRDETQSDLGGLIEKKFEDNESFHYERRFQRDTSGNQQEGSSPHSRMHSDGKIVFPDETKPVPVCKESTFCERVDTYPEDIVTKAIQRNESLKYLAGVDVISDIAQRIDVTDDVPLCVSTEQVIYPQSAENKDNEWKYIANQENFKQGIRIEKCRTESTSCAMFGELAAGYKTSCKQKYVYRQLASVLEDGTLVPDTFRFPSSCCCHVTFSTNPLMHRSLVTPTKTRRRK